MHVVICTLVQFRSNRNFDRNTYMKAYLLGFIFFYVQACAQTVERTDKKIGGPCECCEGIYEQSPDFGSLNDTDTLPGFNNDNNKMLVYGTIYKVDGITVAAGVIMYIYHTDQQGYYTSLPGQTGCAKRHGRLRGWIKTGKDGSYFFYTNRPAAYPGEDIPAHIHPVIKEPGLTAYYIDEYRFDDDPFLTKAERSNAENRGGNGIVMLVKHADGLLLCKRDIVLGKNIPDY